MWLCALPHFGVACCCCLWADCSFLVYSTTATCPPVLSYSALNTAHAPFCFLPGILLTLRLYTLQSQPVARAPFAVAFL